MRSKGDGADRPTVLTDPDGLDGVHLSDHIISQTLLALPLGKLLAAARRRRDAAHPRLQTYSPKVFIPLTQLCRNLCHYCTFSQPPRPGEPAYLMREELLAIARAGKAAG